MQGYGEVERERGGSTGNQDHERDEATGTASRGVALAWREGTEWEIEETKMWGPNALAFRMITANVPRSCGGM